MAELFSILLCSIVNPSHASLVQQTDFNHGFESWQLQEQHPRKWLIKEWSQLEAQYPKIPEGFKDQAMTLGAWPQPPANEFISDGQSEHRNEVCLFKIICYK